MQELWCLGAMTMEASRAAGVGVGLAFELGS